MRRVGPRTFDVVVLAVRKSEMMIITNAWVRNECIAVVRRCWYGMLWHASGDRNAHINAAR
eukprot:6165727-Lingulodinium_polyedra.AAC.1